jgi:hypothetical protein
MSDEKIIRFPGGANAKTRPTGTAKEAASPAAPPAAGGVPDLRALTPDQKKAMEIVLSGMAFVMVGIRPSQSGADFWTALHGEPADLRNAQASLDSVISRAYVRKGI